MSLAGSFLIARPVLQDPNFVQTVVLLLAHNDDGAFGVIVNRPAKAEGVPFPVFVGGPCPLPGLLMLHGHGDWADEPAEEENEEKARQEVAPGIFLGDAACLTRVSDPESNEGLRFRVVTGYAGWGSGQLERELAAGAWVLAPANGQVLFDTPAGDLWERLMPPSIPQPSMN